MPSRRVTRAPGRERQRGLVALLLCAVMISVSAPPTRAASPPTAQPPTVSFVLNHTLTSVKVPVGVTWPEATRGDTKVARYKLQVSRDEGPWSAVTLSTALARSATVKLRPGMLSRFRVRAVDTAGLASAWATAGPNWLALVHDGDPDINTTGIWTASNVTSAYGGRLHTSIDAGATATYTFHGKQVAWVAPLGPDRGQAHVSTTGKPAKTVDLLAGNSEPRRIVFTQGWDEAAERSIQVAVDGTPGRPRVDFDALLTLGPPRTTVLVGAGDIATCEYANDEATAAVVKSTAGTVFTTGDNVYQTGTSIEFRECYGPSWGQFRERTRPAAGNHDYKASSTAAPYFKYFGARAGTPGQGWYAYDSGTWRVYSLNSNCPYVGGCTTSSAQYAWLEADLAANPRRCVAAYWHHPRFSSGRHGGTTAMDHITTLLYDRGAEVVVAGHDHSYERFAPMTPTGATDSQRGIRNFVVGTGGGSLYAPGTVAAPNSEVLETQTYGVLKLTLDWSGYAWKFLAAGAGTFTDSGTDTCH